MKTALKILAFTSALFLSAINSSAASTVVLTPSTTNINVGDSFTVDVIFSSALAGITSPDELLAFGFNAGATSQLALIGSSVASIFDDTSALLGLSAAGLAFPSIPVDGSTPDFVLASFTFQALTAGLANFSVSTDLTDLNQGLFFAGLDDAIAINGSLDLTVAAVPVPAAVWLFLSGVGALRLHRKTR